MTAPLKLGFRMAPSSQNNFAPRSQNAVSNSARLAEAERTINQLEEENSRLLQELNNIRAVYKQLTTESTHESFDERRVNLLKSQVIQLERQNALLSETIKCHAETLMEAENALAATIDFCQSIVARKENINEVKVSCTELDQIISTLESARKRLCRNSEKSSLFRSCSKPLLWYGSFLKNHPDQPVTLFDVCQGDIKHINLKHVSRLESKLVGLYKSLMLINTTLRICIQSSSGAEVITAAPLAVCGRLSDQVKHSCDLLQDVCSQLLQLSLLVPAAPLPALNKPPLEPLTLENVIKVFGKSAKTRDAKLLIEALIKYVNISVNHAGIENQLLLEELEFHRAIYEFETQYVELLFPSVNKCYADFESDMQEVICQPLEEVLQAFSELTESADNNALLHFIEVFRNHAPGLSETVQRLSLTSHVDTECQFSDYGRQFLNKLKHCHAECKRKRDLNIAKSDAVKQQLCEQTKELVQIISEKDQHLHKNDCSDSGQRPTEMPFERQHGSLEVKCTCKLKNMCTLVHKVDNFDEFPENHKSSSDEAPFPLSTVSSVLPTTSLSSMRDSPPVGKQSRTNRIMPGIVKQSLILKPSCGNSHCSETFEKETLSQARLTGNRERNAVTGSSSEDFLLPVPNVSDQTAVQRMHWVDFTDSAVSCSTGRRSKRTAASSVTRPSGFRPFT